MIVCMQILVRFNVNEPEGYYDSKTKLSIISLGYNYIRIELSSPGAYISVVFSI